MHVPTLRRPGAALVALLVAATLGLSACGGEDEPRASDPSTSESPSPTESEPTETEPTESEPTEPECAQVWVDGAFLPDPYRGCFDAEKGSWQEAMVYRCSSGQKLVTYRRNFYAVPGEKVIESTQPLARNAAFQKALKTCGA